MTVRTVAMLTAGGLAPCLSSAVGGLIERYTEVAPDVRIIAYRNGYAGLLTGDRVEVTDEVREKAHLLHRFGGSPIGNSRVKLTNVADCVRRGLVQEGQDPLHVAAEQLEKDGVDVLHTIGGDDTNGTAADLAAYLHEHGYELTVVGLPKTIDNDVVPIRQSLGAWTAAEQGAIFARNIVAEHSSNPRMLIVHEVMGRNCGWLTAATAKAHHDWVQQQEFAGWLENRRRAAGTSTRSTCRSGPSTSPRRPSGCDRRWTSRRRQPVPVRGRGHQRDRRGHGGRGRGGDPRPVRPRPARQGQPGAWFAKQFAAQLGAEKVLVQKSGYFSRSAAPNDADLALIRGAPTSRSTAAMRGESGVDRRGRGAWQRAARDRVRPDQGRQGVRHLGGVVQHPARRPRPDLAGARMAEQAGTTAYRQARDALLSLQGQHDRALAEFRWPDVGERFNWAIDWFDADRPRQRRLALWIVEEDGSEQQVSFDEMAQRSDQVAVWLAGVGVGRGDRVLAHARQPGRAVGDDARGLQARRCRHADDRGAGARRPARPGRARRGAARGRQRRPTPPSSTRCPATTCAIAVGGADGWRLLRRRVCREGRAVRDPGTARRTPLLHYFTSGTTSKPKLVEHTQVSYPVGHLSTMYWIGLRPRRRAPRHQLAGVGQARLVVLLRAVDRRGDRLRLQLLAVRRGGAARGRSAGRGSPRSARRRRSGACSSRRTSPAGRVRCASCCGAGEPLNPEVIAQVQQAWGLTIRDGYGQTETTLQIGNIAGERLKPGSMGRPMPGVPVALIDPLSGEPADGGRDRPRPRRSTPST